MLNELLNFVPIELVFLSEFVYLGLILLVDYGHSVDFTFVLDIYFIEFLLIGVNL